MSQVEPYQRFILVLSEASQRLQTAVPTDSDKGNYRLNSDLWRHRGNTASRSVTSRRQSHNVPRVDAMRPVSADLCYAERERCSAILAQKKFKGGANYDKHVLLMPCHGRDSRKRWLDPSPCRVQLGLVDDVTKRLSRVRKRRPSGCTRSYFSSPSRTKGKRINSPSVARGTFVDSCVYFAQAPCR